MPRSNFLQWLFIIGAFLFLLWYFPLAVVDGRVTLVEAFTIGINFVCITVNALVIVDRTEL